MVKLLINKEDCCGCAACMSVCPTKAIEMRSDEEGFQYPKIRENLCISCGLCRKVCAFQNGYNTAENLITPFVFAVKHKELSVRMSSTSGGAFTAISDYVLSDNGVIFGVSFDDKLKVIHKKAETKDERDTFKGSKYVQSDLNGTFEDIKKLLIKNKTVLFTGTPCQTAGLKSYLNKVNTEKLFLCDIVCHGVPSPLMWTSYLGFIHKIKDNLIKYYKFRDKKIGWHGANVEASFLNGEIETNTNLLKTFVNLYFSQLITRPCCHCCKYTNLNRPSDLTIADFWGIEKCLPEFDDNKGVSLVLVNTKKGQVLFDNLKNSIDFRESNTAECLQPQLQYPVKPNLKREDFWSDYGKFGYEFVAKKYAGYGLKNEIKRITLKVLIKLRLVSCAKKILKRGK